jgi:hypothetical protein
MVPQSVGWSSDGLPMIERPLSRREADWVLYTQTEIAPDRLRAGAFSPKVPTSSPRISATLRSASVQI